ncbi:hypothetical protein OUZ56_028002 [Daphnia magna]|uniref:Uncharacterized protein n=1 Tax=Daphnia magna TaxID=35525 RepID=A0ABR0B2R9_9CRUS|nr:hypothetical protein OUZ56_028002 [Daphnia magna]
MPESSKVAMGYGNSPMVLVQSKKDGTRVVLCGLENVKRSDPRRTCTSLHLIEVKPSILADPNIRE